MARASETWHEYRTDNFVLVSDANRAEVEELAKSLEHFRFVIGRITGVAPARDPRPLFIYVGRDQKSYEKAAPFPWTAGVYSASPLGAGAAMSMEEPENKFDLDGRTVLFHEYVHHFLAQYSPHSYPYWYNEGFAEYLANMSYDDGIARVGLPAMYRLSALYRGRRLPLKDILDSNRGYVVSHRRTSLAILLFYAQSWAFVHYLQSDPERREQLVDFLTRLNRQQDVDSAFEAAFGTSYEEAGAALNAYVDAAQYPFSGYDFRAENFDPAVAVNPLEPAEGRAHQAITQAYFIDEDDYLGRIRKRLKKAIRSDPANVRLINRLAHIEILYGSTERAAELIDKSLGTDPERRETKVLSAALAIKRAEEVDDAAQAAQAFADARARLEPLARQAPNDLTAQYFLCQAHLKDGKSDAAVGLAAAERALRLLPQLEGLHMDYAELALRAERPELAQPVLARLVNWSPSRETRRKAGRLLKEIG